MKKIIRFTTIFALMILFNVNIVSGSNIDHLSVLPDYCNEPLGDDSTVDYSVCYGDDTDDTTDDVNTPTNGTGTTDEQNTDDIPDYCNEPLGDDTSLDYSLCYPDQLIEVYDGEFITKEGTYNRIEYNSSTGKWSGIVLIKAFDLNSHIIDNTNAWVDVKFSRDLEELMSIQYKYITNEGCDLFSIFDLCIGRTTAPREVEITAYNLYEDGSFLETFLYHNENIIEYSSFRDSDEYDYRIILEGLLPNDTIHIFEFLEFQFILTDEEIIQLGLDIQDQYDFEVGLIADDPDLTLEEKNNLLDELNEEYAEIPELEFGMVFEQECSPDTEGCIQVLEEQDYTTVQEILWTDIESYVKGVILLVFVVIFTFTLGLETLLAVGELILDVIVQLAKMIASIVYKIIIEPIINTVVWLISTVIDLMFGWI